MVENILQCMHVSNHHVSIPSIYIIIYVTYFLIKLEKKEKEYS